MRLAIDLMAAPAALIRTAARGDEIHRTLAVVAAPGFYIALQIDGMASRPGLRIQIWNLCPWRILMEHARRIEVRNSCNLALPTGFIFVCFSAERCQQFFHRRLAFAEDDEICARLQIFEGVGAGLRAANDDLPTGFSRHSNDLDHITARHQIGVDAENRGRLAAQTLEQEFAARERRIEDIYVESFGAQMRTKVKNAEGRIGLHDLKLFRIFEEKIAVCEQEVRHVRPPSMPRSIGAAEELWTVAAPAKEQRGMHGRFG